MKRYVSFILSSKFGFFRKPDFSSKDSPSCSYNWIPLTNLYGLLGACIGLNGYESLGDNRKRLEYMSLRDLLRIAIIPLDSNNNLKMDSFDKEIVVYNTNLHTVQNTGFAQCREQILVNPKFEIILEIDEEKIISKVIELKLDDKFLNLSYVEKFLNGPMFTIYLGKNEFLASILNIKEEVAEEKTENKEFTFSSLFLKEDCEITRRWDASIIQDQYTTSEFLPYDYDDNIKYRYKEFFLSNSFIESNANLEHIIKIKRFDKPIYVYMM